MERQKEIDKLLNVLRRMARTARMNQWTGTREQADEYSIEQYNRILERLKALDGSGVLDLFVSLPQGSSWSTVANACRDVGAFYEDEPAHNGGPGRAWGGVWAGKHGIWIDRSAFTSGFPQEVHELGNFIREKVTEWQEQRRRGPRRGEPGGTDL